MKYTLKELRARNSFTQSEMAKMLGVTLQTYNHWENNLQDLKISRVKAIAEVLGVSIDDINLTKNMN